MSNVMAKTREAFFGTKCKVEIEAVALAAAINADPYSDRPERFDRLWYLLDSLAFLSRLHPAIENGECRGCSYFVGDILHRDHAPGCWWQSLRRFFRTADHDVTILVENYGDAMLVADACKAEAAKLSMDAERLLADAAEWRRKALAFAAKQREPIA